jgi:Flp pilus assembly protein TadD
MTNERYSCRRVFPASGAMILALLLSACAGHLSFTDRIAPLNGQPLIAIADVDLHAVSPEMEAFLDRYVSEYDIPDGKARNLVLAATDRNALPFEYNPTLTLNSVETFSAQTGNCLAFSTMLVAMARHRGLTAYYQEVEIPPQWNSIKNNLLFSLHINVVVEGRSGEWIVDISGRESMSTRKVKRITDTEALAQYYNNLGADALMDENLALAYAYFVKAVNTMPRAAYLWSNLAVVFSRNDQLEDGRQAYITALKLDPDSAIAANNLYLIYEKEGNLEAAGKLQSRVERHRRKNPYYLYHLSSLAIEEGRYAESREMLQKAISLNDKEYRFHYELARSLFLEGNREAAQASLERAVQLAPDNTLNDSTQIDQLPELPD